MYLKYVKEMGPEVCVAKSGKKKKIFMTVLTNELSLCSLTLFQTAR